jgi:hypothetical protein
MVGIPTVRLAHHPLNERGQMSPLGGHRRRLGKFLPCAVVHLGLLFCCDADFCPSLDPGLLWMW